MRISHDALIYQDADEFELSRPWRSLVHEARYQAHDVLGKLCRDFDMKVPHVSVYMFEGDVVGTKVITSTLGFVTTEIYNGRFVSAQIFLSLPYLIGTTSKTMNDTIPHEVAHVFADYVYKKSCMHDAEWFEIMEYLGIPAYVHSFTPSADMNNVIAAMRYHSIKELDHETIEIPSFSVLP